VRKVILSQQKQLTANLLREPNADQRRLMNEYYERNVTQVDTVRRQQRLEKRSAARQVLLAPLSQSNIKTDTGRSFPGVLSYPDWDKVRQAETQREAARVTLKSRKEANRAALGVASGGHPLSETDPQIQQALQPFVEACAAARAQQEEHVREVLKQRETARQRGPITLPPPVATDQTRAEPTSRQVDVVDGRH
jgi:hypothetical protein